MTLTRTFVVNLVADVWDGARRGFFSEIDTDSFSGFAFLKSISNKAEVRSRSTVGVMEKSIPFDIVRQR